MTDLSDRKPMPVPVSLGNFGRRGVQGQTWVTSDLHLGHKNILEHCNRPWSNIDKHDNDLLKNINDTVGEDDWLIIVGDLTMAGGSRQNYAKRVVERLPKNKILILGNHDRIKPMTLVKWGFAMVTTALVVEDILMIHDPKSSTFWPKHNLVVAGHVHDRWKMKDNVYNVGVDVNDFRPINLGEVIRDFYAR